ncbi:hypothetical protein [Marinobacter nauticus]|uniref:hypothetical protein n=1 Tax=Marinobacter nauticus TaxID=2743 RepID=UPI001CD29BB2|nr:hypothetical protein [Marinobacter nauticus]MCA0912767.1 hypothetical protein [Marinobacter nauticus]
MSLSGDVGVILSLFCPDDKGFGTWQECLLKEGDGFFRGHGYSYIGVFLLGYRVIYVIRNDESEDVFLVGFSERIGFGAPVDFIYSKTEGVIWDSEFPRGDWKSGIPDLSFLFSKCGESSEKYSQIVFLVRDHQNFAHVLLNSYTAISRVIPVSPKVAGAVFIGKKFPLGRVDEFFPEIKELKRSEVFIKVSDNFFFSSQLAIPLLVGSKNGRKSLKIPSKDFEGRIVNVKSRLGMDTAFFNIREQVDKSKSPVVWVSIRGYGKRNASNFEDFVVFFLSSLRASLGNGFTVIFDGLSLQEGFSNEESVRGGPDIKSQIKKENVVADSIIAKMACFEGIEFISLIGLPIVNVMSIARYADFYLCHDGSIQHKIGWLYPETPGIIHGNSQRNVGKEHGWHPVDIGSGPCWLPNKFVIDENEIGGNVPHANYGYKVKFGKDLAEYIKNAHDFF